MIKSDLSSHIGSIGLIIRHTESLAAILKNRPMNNSHYHYLKNFSKSAVIFLIMVLQSCGAVYMDLSSSAPENLIMDDLKSGIIISIPKNTKPIITNMVNIKIYSDSSLIENSEIPWYSNKSFSLPEGKYTVNTMVRYMNHDTWKTSNILIITKTEIKNLSIKYPFLMTGKPKVIIK
jgi:hypothetical protein